jgi:hypothetical protein
VGRWDDVQTNEVHINKIEVEGAFMCQNCDENVEKAFYLSQDRVLTWKCSLGHISYIEKFNL